MTPNERRRQPRVDVCLPIRVDAAQRTNRLALTRDASTRGVLVGTTSRFQVGEVLTLTFRADATEDNRSAPIAGEVVRVADNSKSENVLWRYLTAIRFTEEHPELAQMIGDTTEERRAESRGDDTPTRPHKLVRPQSS